MRDDEIVAAGRRQRGARVGAEGGEAVLRAHGGDTPGEEAQHGGTGVDCVGMQLRIGGEEAREKSSVAIADDEGAAAGEQRGEVEEAAALEEGAEGEVLHDAIEKRDAVEAGDGPGRRIVVGV